MNRCAIKSSIFLILTAALSISCLRQEESASQPEPQIEEITPEIRETVFWYITEHPPAFIGDGRYEGKGYADRFIDDLALSLPGYNHEIRTGNLTRAFNDMDTLDNVVFVGLLKNSERERKYLFTESLMIILANRLFIRRNSLPFLRPYISEDGYFVIEEFLSGENGRLAVLSERSYGPVIDSALSSVADGEAVVRRPAEDQMPGLIKLLMDDSRGIDAILGYSDEVNYALKEMNIDDSVLVSFPVSGSKPYYYVYAGISRSEFGQKLLGEVNPLIRLNRHEAFSGYYQDWLSDEEARFHKNLTNELYVLEQNQN